MRTVCYLLGVILIIVAIVYFMMPADQLPSFMPGFDPVDARVHVKHGVASAVAGVVLFAIGWFMGRRA